MDKKFVYADNAATTKVSQNAVNAMLPYFTENYGNPSSIYNFGVTAHIAVEKAREQIATVLGAERPDEIFFTSGGSESDNWAIKGAAHLGAKKGKKHIISTEFEHHAVLHTLNALEKEGFEITLLPVYDNGIVKVSDVEKAIREDTALVTIMYANNEIGTIQPIAEIGALCRKKGILFHTDAVQAVSNVPINVVEQNIDMLSLSGHKLHAPKGVGALYIRRGIRIPNLIEGGAQEKGRRAGTENVPSIVALGVAITEACDNIEGKSEKLKKMRDKIIDFALTLPKVRLNGDREKRLPGNVNLSFAGVEGEALLLSLDNVGVSASSGSACTSGSLDPSHVLLSIGLKHEIAHGSLRLSFSDYNNPEDADYIISVLPEIIERLRKMSPLWERMLKEEN
jgi:cysteine desulfurase